MPASRAGSAFKVLQRSWSSTLRELCLVGGHHLTDTALEGIGERLHRRHLAAREVRTLSSARVPHRFGAGLPQSPWPPEAAAIAQQGQICPVRRMVDRELRHSVHVL